MDKLDYKKANKALYLPGTTPGIITVPEMTFIMVDGRGNPNDEDGEYKSAVGLLYGLSWTIKMSKTGEGIPANYFEYVVPPLEGLWWLADDSDVNFTQKDKFCWTSLIRQPEFVTDEVFAWACLQTQEKKKLDTSGARLAKFDEGLCVQCMHHGPFDDEPATIARMHEFIEQNNLVADLSKTRRHHEIYLTDPRKVTPEKMKTILRLPVRRK